jgi:hypothetical protein
MVLEFIDSNGKFFKNVAFIGYAMVLYTDGVPISNTFVTPKTHKIIWTFKDRV